MMAEFVKKRSQKLMSPRCALVKLANYLVLLYLAWDSQLLEYKALYFEPVMGKFDPDLLLPGANVHDAASVISEDVRVTGCEHDGVQSY